MITAQTTGVLSDGIAIDALTMLQRVSERDISEPILDWLCKRQPAGDVLDVALRTLTTCAKTDVADRIFSKPEYLHYFSAPTARRPSGQNIRAALMAAGRSPEIAASPELSPAEIFFRDRLRSEPLRNAERLVDHRDEVDISRPLAALFDVSFTPKDNSPVAFALRRLADSDASQVVLTKTLRAIPDFAGRMRGPIESMLNDLATTENADAIARFRASVAAAAVVAPAPKRAAPGLGNLTKTVPFGSPSPFAFAPTVATPELPRRSVRFRTAHATSSVLYLTFGAALIAGGAFLFNGDIPGGATPGVRALSRGLSLLAALIFWGAIAFMTADASRELRRGITKLSAPLPSTNREASNPLSQFVPLAAIVGAYAVLEMHRQYVGPTHFWNQSAVFLLNSVGILFCSRAFELE